ncbi:MAG: thiamine phosphate synthase [Gemmatimonadetes bacterium]|nr:thiamine phosphate synthase [Gemmatimonadota bacterium]
MIVITDAALAAPRDLDEIVVAALEAGAPALQLRDKAAMPAELYRQAVRYRELTRRHGALLFINDRLDVALAAHADGVHLGPEDLPLSAARRAVAAARPHSRSARFLIGFSTDDPATASAAESAGADYIGCGAVFGTTSKEGIGDERIGTGRLADVASRVAIPVVGIGGITPDNVDAVADAGADGVAGIGAVMTAPDVAAAVRRLLEPFTPRQQ